MKRIAAVLAAIGLTLAPALSAEAKGSCTADAVVLGQLPAFTGATSTDWFNAFGFGLDTGHSWTVSFSVPVLPFPGMSPTTGPLTSFPVPSYIAGSDGSFKATFRAQNAGVDSIRITVTDGSCTASHLLSFLPNTATAGSSDQATGPNLAVSAAVGVATAALLLFFGPTLWGRRRSGDIR